MLGPGEVTYGGSRQCGEGRFQQAPGRRHTQGRWQHQRHGGHRAPPSRGEPGGRQSEVRGPAGQSWARLLGEWHRCGGSHTLVLPKKHPSRVAPISGKSTHEAWCIAGAQEQGPASVTVGPLREGKRVRTAVRAGAGCTADPRPPLPREGQLRAACRSAWVAPGGGLWNARGRCFGRRGAAAQGLGGAPLPPHSLLLPALGPGGSLWGPRDWESVIIKQWRLRKPRTGPGLVRRSRAQ